MLALISFDFCISTYAPWLGEVANVFKGGSSTKVLMDLTRQLEDPEILQGKNLKVL